MKTLVAGIGSTIRTDDGVGVAVVRALGEVALPGEVDRVELGTAGLGLAEQADGYEQLIVVDAIVSGAEPGTIQLLDGAEVARAVHLGQGHEADLPVSLAVAQKLLGQRMPARVLVVAIEAADLTTFSEQLSPAVRAAVPRAVDRVLGLLAADA